MELCCGPGHKWNVLRGRGGHWSRICVGDDDGVSHKSGEHSRSTRSLVNVKHCELVDWLISLF